MPHPKLISRILSFNCTWLNPINSPLWERFVLVRLPVCWCWMTTDHQQPTGKKLNIDWSHWTAKHQDFLLNGIIKLLFLWNIQFDFAATEDKKFNLKLQNCWELSFMLILGDILVNFNFADIFCFSKFSPPPILVHKNLDLVLKLQQLGLTPMPRSQYLVLVWTRIPPGQVATWRRRLRSGQFLTGKSWM